MNDLNDFFNRIDKKLMQNETTIKIICVICFLPFKETIVFINECNSSLI